MHSASRNVRTRNSHIDNSTIERAMFGISLPDAKEKRTDSAMKRKDRYSLDLEIKQYWGNRSKIENWHQETGAIGGKLSKIEESVEENSGFSQWSICWCVNEILNVLNSNTNCIRWLRKVSSQSLQKWVTNERIRKKGHRNIKWQIEHLSYTWDKWVYICLYLNLILAVCAKRTFVNGEWNEQRK